MDTITIQCGRCGNVMAVGLDHLGQQVRCPHCQEVVLAPAGTSPASPELFAAALTPGPEGAGPSARDEHPESIFAPVHDEDVMGGGARPQVEVPLEPPALPPPSPAAPQPDAAPPAYSAPFAAGGLSGIGWSVAEESSPAPSSEAPPQGMMELPASAPWQPAATPEPAAEAPVQEERVLVRTQPRSGCSMVLLTLLVPYSVFMTAIAFYLYSRTPVAQDAPGATPPSNAHPLELLPDEGLNPGVRRVLRGQRFPGEGQGAELPPHLRVALGKTLRVGDLEVTPLDVRLRRVTINTENFDPTHELALVLRLHLKNVSTNVAFHPVDPFFDRSWTGEAGDKPYTFLDMGGRRFYGGPIEWDNAIPKRDNPRQFIPEQHQDRDLKPGEEMDTIVCTNPHDKVENDLKFYRGPLQWHIQLRRGLVEVRKHDASATAVIGVDFQDSDVVSRKND
jgi:hypothetical protein